MQLTDNARTVLERRYLKKQDGQVVETPEQMVARVAKNIAAVEATYDSQNVGVMEEIFFQMIDNLEFVPNSPTLMNAGRSLQQLAACFVLPIEDSMESIFETLKNTALIQKSGGGTGFSFSRLRPKNDTVKTTGGVASGPISFLKCFNASTEAVKQGGTRRGANMGILRVDHPDILEFIQCKAKDKEISNFNISVGITEPFMTALAADEEYDLISPRTQSSTGRLKAKEVFAQIVKMAWQNGEPGIVFLDRINAHNPTPHLGEIEATNPCGEQPLLPNESCNLGSLNLAKMVKKTEGAWDVDWERLANITRNAVRFLDNVIDANAYPIKAIEERTKQNRKIGLGVMGFADMLLRLGISYASDEAVELAKKVMKFIQTSGYQASRELAKERGCFPSYQGSVHEKNEQPMRNATVTTIAPTGTISIIAGCSSGVEPLFALAFTRNVMDQDKLVETNPIFAQLLQEYGIFRQEIIEKVAEGVAIADIAAIPRELQEILVTAHNISPEWHIKMQAAFQAHTDNAVSKTVNFPNEASEKDIEKVFRLAYDLGCKGVTVYRSGSRDQEVLTVGHKTAQPDAPSSEKEQRRPRQRPNITKGQTERVRTGCGTLYVTINEDDEGVCEVFTTIGKAGGCAAAFSEATARMISLSLRSGVDPAQVGRQLKSIRCPQPMWQNGTLVLSCPDAIAAVINRLHGQDDQPVTGNQNEPQSFEAGACPDCGGRLRFESGCATCIDCGFSRCG